MTELMWLKYFNRHFNYTKWNFIGGFGLKNFKMTSMPVPVFVSVLWLVMLHGIAYKL